MIVSTLKLRSCGSSEASLLGSYCCSVAVDVARVAKIVIADGFLLVAAAVETAKVNWVERTIAAVVVAAVAAEIFVTAATGAVVLKVPGVTIVVIVAEAVHPETGSAAKTAAGFAASALPAAAAAASVRDSAASPFVAETVSPSAMRSTELNSC